MKMLTPKQIKEAVTKANHQLKFFKKDSLFKEPLIDEGTPFANKLTEKLITPEELKQLNEEK